MFALPEGKPALMGILNVTPDSFSDGGLFVDPTAAVEAALAMMDDGADMIDVGGESTRPGATPVSAEDEIKRVIPIVEVLASRNVPISIDTMKPIVARAALEAGAFLVNDVGGLRNPEMVDLVAERKCSVCIMHMQGEPRTMQVTPGYDDVVAEVSAFLLERGRALESRGIPRQSIWIDPGIGFGKTVAHNLLLLEHLGVFVETGFPVLVGVSRKSFIGKVLGDLGVSDRLEGTLAAQVVAQIAGARIIRAHDVKEARRAIDMVHAIRSA